MFFYNFPIYIITFCKHPAAGRKPRLEKNCEMNPDANLKDICDFKCREIHCR